MSLCCISNNLPLAYEHGHLGLVTVPFAAPQSRVNSLEKNLSELDVRRALSAKCTFVPFLSWVYDRSPILPVVWRPHQEDFHNSSIYRMVLEWPMCQTPDIGPAHPRALQSPSRPARASLPLQPGSTGKEGISFSFPHVGCWQWGCCFRTAGPLHTRPCKCCECPSSKNVLLLNFCQAFHCMSGCFKQIYFW